MLGTTTLFLGSYSLATCLFVVVTDPGWLSAIERVCARRMFQDWKVLGFGCAWGLWVGIQIQVAHCWCACPYFPSVSCVSSLSVFVRLGICSWEFPLTLPYGSIICHLLLCLFHVLSWGDSGCEQFLAQYFVYYSWYANCPFLVLPAFLNSIKYFLSVILLAFW